MSNILMLPQFENRGKGKSSADPRNRLSPTEAMFHPTVEASKIVTPDLTRGRTTGSGQQADQPDLSRNEGDGKQVGGKQGKKLIGNVMGMLRRPSGGGEKTINRPLGNAEASYTASSSSSGDRKSGALSFLAKGVGQQRPESAGLTRKSVTSSEGAPRKSLTSADAGPRKSLTSADAGPRKSVPPSDGSANVSRPGSGGSVGGSERRRASAQMPSRFSDVPSTPSNLQTIPSLNRRGSTGLTEASLRMANKMVTEGLHSNDSMNGKRIPSHTSYLKTLSSDNPGSNVSAEYIAANMAASIEYPHGENRRRAESNDSVESADFASSPATSVMMATPAAVNLRQQLPRARRSSIKKIMVTQNVSRAGAEMSGTDSMTFGRSSQASSSSLDSTSSGAGRFFSPHMAQSKLAQSNSSGSLGVPFKDLGSANSGHVLYSPRKPLASSEDHVSKSSSPLSVVPPVASHRALKSIWSLPKKLLQDFNVIKQIGHGAFATVHLVRYAGKVESDEETRLRTNATLAELGVVPSGRQGPLNDTAWVSNKVYALKALKKQAVIAKRQVKQVLNEKKLLEVVRSDAVADSIGMKSNVYLGGSNFIVQLMSTFQDPVHLCFVMEYVPGGDLYTLIRKHRRFAEADARLMAAELVLAVSYLHGRSIVYRDLKPENILVSATGHMKLADFGFAKRIPDRPSSSGDEIVRGSTKTFCGTPAYMAPEIVMRLPHGLPVDWFSLGVVIYEMIAGYTPFGKGSDVNAIYKNILSGVDDPHHRWSSQITPTARELLRQMMHPNPLMRTGGTNDAGAGIMKHAWFRSINWDDLSAQASNGPYVPVISSETDVRNFDEYTTESSVIRMARGEATKDPVEDGDDLFKDF